MSAFDGERCRRCCIRAESVAYSSDVQHLGALREVMGAHGGRGLFSELENVDGGKICGVVE